MTVWLKVSIRIVILWGYFNSLFLIHVQIFKDTCYTWRQISSKFVNTWRIKNPRDIFLTTGPEMGKSHSNVSTLSKSMDSLSKKNAPQINERQPGYKNIWQNVKDRCLWASCIAGILNRLSGWIDEYEKKNNHKHPLLLQTHRKIPRTSNS